MLRIFFFQKWLTCNGRCGGPPILWWYMTSCFNCDDICAWLLWCLPISASASALLKIPSFNPEKMSPYKCINHNISKIKKLIIIAVYCLMHIKRIKWWIFDVTSCSMSMAKFSIYLFNKIHRMDTFRQLYLLKLEVCAQISVSKDTKLPNHKFMCINYESHTRCILDYVLYKSFFTRSHTKTHTHTFMRERKRQQKREKAASNI